MLLTSGNDFISISLVTFQTGSAIAVTVTITFTLCALVGTIATVMASILDWYRISRVITVIPRFFVSIGRTPGNLLIIIPLEALQTGSTVAIFVAVSIALGTFLAARAIVTNILNNGCAELSFLFLRNSTLRVSGTDACFRNRTMCSYRKIPIITAFDSILRVCRSSVLVLAITDVLSECRGNENSQQR
jgi:hypothetical protein